MSSHPLQLKTVALSTATGLCNTTPSWVSLCNRGCRFPWEVKQKKKDYRNLSINCRGSAEEDSRRMSPYEVLGVDPSCSLADLKVAFRAKVKEFHPDVCKDVKVSDAMIRRVIKAYELLSETHQPEASVRENVDPFDEPECEALDIFVNEAVCVGTGCPNSCVEMAPHAFSFNSIYGTAQATSQGHGDNYRVQLAAGQCPRRCIHYVTPLQRLILEELLDSVLSSPFSSAEAAVLDSLIAKARFENNRYQKPKKKESKASSEFVDWF
ncbi:hypothetical protein H6P81_002432 [Aristolochia fimbriata]|uniref:J domain-containing protein n=1 Tax=Aristolochia fimbriata TaxID=158543 RepID=A0AAV7FBE9_ARIFI|nr:hypothetical protein H6P81_002432 [Aristolochia fimbriata]